MAYLVEPNGEPVLLTELPNFKKAQEIVGGDVEVIRMSDGRKMLANEDGNIKQLPVNHYASSLTLWKIVGTVIYGTAKEIDKICSK